MPGIVIISTRATDVSIQAVSPEFGVQLSSVLASHGSGGTAASAGAAAGAGAGACANDASTARTVTTTARISPQARATSPAREVFLNVMVWLLSVAFVDAGSQRCIVGLAGA